MWRVILAADLSYPTRCGGSQQASCTVWQAPDLIEAAETSQKTHCCGDNIDVRQPVSPLVSVRRIRTCVTTASRLLVSFAGFKAVHSKPVERADLIDRSRFQDPTTKREGLVFSPDGVT